MSGGLVAKAPVKGLRSSLALVTVLQVGTESLSGSKLDWCYGI